MTESVSFSGLRDVLEVLQPVVYGGLGIVAFAQWWRHRGQAAAWLAASLSVLSVVVVAGELLPESPDGPLEVWAGKLMVAVLVLFPYFLYRFMTSFLTPVRWVRAAATGVTVALALGALVLPEFPADGEPRPAWFEIYIAVLLLQWVFLSGLVAVRLWRAGRGQPMVARRRMQTMSIGAAALALALVVAGEVSSEGAGAEMIVGLLALAAGPLILVGFAPPAFLRLAWRRREEPALKEARLALMRAATAPEAARTLLPAARRLVGARATLLEDADGEILATDGLDKAEARATVASLRGDRPGSDGDANGALVTVPLESGRLTVVAGPFAPFFGRDEITRLEELAALGDLALARSRLIDNQRRLAAIVESSDDAIISKTLDGTITTWNRGAERLYRYSAEEALGKPITLIVPPGLEGQVTEFLDRVRRDESIEHYETTRRTKDGRTIAVSLTISPLRDADGKVTGASAIARDVSERKRAESQRDTMLALTRVLAESSTVAEAAPRLLEELCQRMDWNLGTLWLVDEAGETLELASHWRDARLPEPEVHAPPAVARFALGEGLPGEVWQRGEPIWIEDIAEVEGFVRSAVIAAEDVRGAAALPVWSGPEVLGVVELFSREPRKPDPLVSDLLAAVGGQAGSLVARARAAHDREEAKQDAERANHAKSEFLSRMSHELRTPLNAVLGFAQLLDLDKLDDRQRDGVNHILKAGHHLVHLVDEVLDIARIEAGEMRLSLEPVAAVDITDESIALVRPLAERRGITIETDFGDGEQPWVLADRQRLKQVLLNLLSNAIKYNRENGLVRVTLEPRPDERLAIRVADTGPGIPPEHKQQLFEPFERLGAEETSVEGTGLGLALSKRLVEAMGGAIDAESDPDHGTTMSVELPRTPPNGPPRPRAEVRPIPPLRGRTVLYIEDNLANVRLVERLLERFTDVRLLPAMQGNLGLELAREHKPDLVLLDLNLPDLTGREVLLRLRAEPALRATPIIVVSADATEREQKRLLAAGADAYFTKPLDVAQFLTALAHYLGGETPRQAD